MLRECEFLLHMLARGFEEEDNKQCGNSAKWKIDVETPAPGEMVSEDTTQATYVWLAHGAQSYDNKEGG